MKTTTILANNVDFGIYLRGLEIIARDLKIESFSKKEAREWLVSGLKGQIPTLEAIKEQWTWRNPEEYGDPFGILTFWADQEQGAWDARQPEARVQRFPRTN
jgi:hypothetical protein